MSAPVLRQVTRRRQVGTRLLVAALLLSTLVCAGGWWWTQRQPHSLSPECWSLDDDRQIRFGITTGQSTESFTFAASEEDTRVRIGWGQHVASGIFTQEGYLSEVTVGLREPLGDREVVDFDGDPVPRC